jgi:hypothetical protein
MQPVSSVRPRIGARMVLVSGLMPSHTKCAAITVLSSTHNQPARIPLRLLIIFLTNNYFDHYEHPLFAER